MWTERAAVKVINGVQTTLEKYKQFITKFKIIYWFIM